MYVFNIIHTLGTNIWASIAFEGLLDNTIMTGGKCTGMCDKPCYILPETSVQIS